MTIRGNPHRIVICLAQGGFLLSRTGHAEGSEAFVTSDFRLHASYFV